MISISHVRMKYCSLLRTSQFTNREGFIYRSRSTRLRRRRLPPPQSPHCAQRASHPPPRAARPPPASARAQSRDRAWGWRHSAPWSSASPCLSPADTDDALLRLPERVTVPRNSTGSSSAPKSFCTNAAGSVACTVILLIGDGQNDGDARRLGLGRVRCRAQVVNCSSSAPLVVTWIS